MKVKTASLLIKILLITAGLLLCVLHWLGKLPEASVQDIWIAIGTAYGIGLGTVDLNICRDSWTGNKINKENTDGNTDVSA